MDWLGGFFNNFIGGVSDIFSSIGSGVGGFFDNLFDFADDKGGSLFGDLMGSEKGGLDDVLGGALDSVSKESKSGPFDNIDKGQLLAGGLVGAVNFYNGREDRKNELAKIDKQTQGQMDLLREKDSIEDGNKASAYQGIAGISNGAKYNFGGKPAELQGVSNQVGATGPQSKLMRSSYELADYGGKSGQSNVGLQAPMANTQSNFMAPGMQGVPNLSGALGGAMGGAPGMGLIGGALGMGAGSMQRAQEMIEKRKMAEMQRRAMLGQY